jgi:hypothetical protein
MASIFHINPAKGGSMTSRVSLLTIVLLAGLLAGACDSQSSSITKPTAVGSSGLGSSSDSSRETPSAPQPAPPPVNRGPAPPTRPPVEPSRACDASKAFWVVGRAASDQLLEQAREAAGAGLARFLRPNQPITMEYLASRLNLRLDHLDIVRSVSCG